MATSTIKLGKLGSTQGKRMPKIVQITAPCGSLFALDDDGGVWFWSLGRWTAVAPLPSPVELDAPQAHAPVEGE